MKDSFSYSNQDNPNNRTDREPQRRNRLKELLTRPTAMVEIPVECRLNEDLTNNEWQAMMPLLEQVSSLLKSSLEKEKETNTGDYDFDMQTGYTHLSAFQSKDDPNLSCTVRMQPRPEKLSDFAYDTKGKELSPEQIREKDVAVTLRYQVAENSWTVCRILFKTSVDYTLLAGNPAQFNELTQRRMSTDLSYLSVYRPNSISFWFENTKPGSEIKEVGVMIPSPKEMLRALAAASENEDFARTLDREMDFFLQRLDAGTVMPELQRMVEEMKNEAELKAFAKHIISKLGLSLKYQIRSLPISSELIDDLTDIFSTLEPKPITSSDLLPPASVVDYAGEEWKSFQSKFLLP